MLNFAQHEITFQEICQEIFGRLFLPPKADQYDLVPQDIGNTIPAKNTPYRFPCVPLIHCAFCLNISRIYCYSLLLRLQEC